MKRAKTKPNKPTRPEKTRLETVIDTNCFNLAIMLLVLNGGFGFGKKRLAQVVEGYLALVQEVADHRAMVRDMVVECRKRTGYDVREMLQYAMIGDYEAWRRRIGL